MPNFAPIDGGTAAAHISYFFSDASIIYPITPSSPIAEYVDAWAAQGRLNAFGQIVRVEEMNSEAAAAGALHGSLSTGALTSTFTASQGLLLMIPNLYKMAGEHLPAVFQVACRSIATHALSIHGDHSDIMAVRQTGACILMSATNQEVMDIGIAAHLLAIDASQPVINGFDGFRTSHGIAKVEMVDYDRIAPHVPHDLVEKFRQRSLTPNNPEARGSCMGPPVFFQAAEATNLHYAAIPSKLEKALAIVKEITGREYHLFDYFGAPDAEEVVVLMGSGVMTMRQAAEYLNAQGRKAGVLAVHLYRPFSAEHFIGALPETCTRLCVLDRAKDPASPAGALFQDVCSVLATTGRMAGLKVLVGGRYGLSSKDFLPSDAVAIYNNLNADKPVQRFSVSINDDVTHMSLPRAEVPDLTAKGTVQCVFLGMGSDGTVGANKTAIKLISEYTDLHAQGYFNYDSFKAFGFTESHLRFGPSPITSEYLVEHADFTSISQQSYWARFGTILVSRCKPNSTLLLNTTARDLATLTDLMPKELRAEIVRLGLKLSVMDASAIADSAGLPGRINTAMQTAFFQLSGVLPAEQAIGILKKATIKKFDRKGDEIVNKNIACIDATCAEGTVLPIAYPANWAEAENGATIEAYLGRRKVMLDAAPEFVRDVMHPVAQGYGDSLPVSKFEQGGAIATGTTQYAKRGIALKMPVWSSATCIQCNLCSMACPHAVIRPYLIDEEEEAQLPENVVDKTVKSRNIVIKRRKLNYKLLIQASPLDCTGCAVCVSVCPTAKKGTLRMVPLPEVKDEQLAIWDPVQKVTNKARDFTPEEMRSLGVAFRQPLFQYHGACAGCGETSNITLATRIFGDRMIIANATGCSSIYGYSYPFVPYTTTPAGRGPAWANSLFEDAAEFGFGMLVGVEARRDAARRAAGKLMQRLPEGDSLRGALATWDRDFDEIWASEKATDTLKPLLAKADTSMPEVRFLQQPSVQDVLSRPIVMVVGGDGWAYDIGFGGLDHVLASGLDITIMVLDTEVYSNTGGQRSKATPLGAVARFAAAGKRTEKKDLAMIAMSYPNVFVGSIALNANPRQAIRVLTDAVEYKGPSIVQCFTPCIEHGWSLSHSALAQKLAVDTSYWLLFSRHPEHGFKLDSRPAKKPLNEYLDKQLRFRVLVKERPEEAAALQKQLADQLTARYERYAKIEPKVSK